PHRGCGGYSANHSPATAAAAAGKAAAVAASVVVLVVSSGEPAEERQQSGVGGDVVVPAVVRLPWESHVSHSGRVVPQRNANGIVRN
nr:hypothetical protein [Tanacetum cinerariifolium]